MGRTVPRGRGWYVDSRREWGILINCCAEALLPDTDWSYEEELESLRQEFGVVADQLRADETKKMINNIEVGVRMEFG
jgi:hypothetical protein